MEFLYPLLALLSGATVVVLGSFVPRFKRKLEKKGPKRDEINRRQTGYSDRSTDGQQSEMQSPKTIRKNDELPPHIAEPTSQARESQRTLDERQNDHGLLMSAQPEIQQLQVEIENLKIRLSTSEAQLATSTKRMQETFDSNTSLEIKITGLKQQLVEKDEVLRGFENQAIDAARLQSENQEFRLEKQCLLEEIGTLRAQFQTNEDRLNGMSGQYEAAVEREARLQTRLSEFERQTDELTVKNQQLQEEVDAISNKLAAAEKHLEEFHLLQDQAHSDNQQLLEANQQLKREFGTMHEQLETLQLQRDEFAKRNQEATGWNEKLQMELSNQRQAAIIERHEAERRAQEKQENYRIQLDARESQLQESVRRYQETADRCTRLEAEVLDNRQQLEYTQLMAQGLETALAEQKAIVESCEMRHQEQQQKLEALTVDLDRELSQRKSQTEALEKSHERLRESERIGQELANENRHLGEEIARWQERFAASEENQGQLSMARQQLDALQAEHSRIIDKNRQLQEKLTAGDEAGRVSSSVEGDSAGATMLQSKIHTLERSASDSTGTGEAGGHFLDSSVSETKPHVAEEEEPSPIAWTSVIRNRRLGTFFAGGIILLIVGAVAMKFLITGVPISSDSAVLGPEATAVEHVAEPVSKPPIKVAPRVRGAFRTVRPTQVFSGPSEYSALIGDIGEGIKLNVVDSRDGWLEIRSRHGRPPGFIRQEAAVRISSN